MEIKTEIIECSRPNSDEALSNALTLVNHVIKSNNINKDDIIEYHTKKDIIKEEYPTYPYNGYIWSITVTISWIE